jgi:glycosyltransferase involved in cell wall biosynthesis
MIAPDKVADAAQIVVVTHFFPAHGGGIEIVASRLVDCYQTRGWRVIWFSSATDSPPTTKEGLDVQPIATCNVIERLTQLPYPIWSLRCVPILWGAIGQSRAVHVHEHLYVGSVLAILFARLRGKRVVVTQHMGDLHFGKPWLTRLYRLGTRGLARLTMRAASSVVFISANVRSYFSGSLRPGRAFVEFNGVDSQLFHPGGESGHSAARLDLGLHNVEPVAIFVGRFVRKKGLNLIHQLAAQMPNVTWLLAGSGPENPETWALPNVKVLGRVPQSKLVQLYRAADVLVLLSRGEGYPLVAQEALACGAAVLSTEEVATACPSATGLIEYTGSAEELRIDDLKVKLRDLLGNRCSYKHRSTRAADAARLWSWEASADRHLKLLGLPGPFQV